MLSGMVETQTDPAIGRPDYVRNIVCDKVTSLTAAQAITAALLARATGKGGQHVRLAMLDAAVAFLWPDAMVNETFVGPDVKRGLTMSDIYAVFEAADGFMAVYISSNAEWEALCRAFARPELIEDERFRSPNRRGRHFRAMHEEIRKMLAGMSVDDVCRRLDEADVPCAPMRSRAELRDDPQVVANELIVEQELANVGRVRQPRPAARFSGTPSALRSAAPGLGEHTDHVLRELGKSDDEIVRLRSEGIVA
jgi:crotonobetainyl-CoA:carnitine CoA-transferase CaiB-like acyl-CoA transferase